MNEWIDMTCKTFPESKGGKRIVVRVSNIFGIREPLEGDTGCLIYGQNGAFRVEESMQEVWSKITGE